MAVSHYHAVLKAFLWLPWPAEADREAMLAQSL